MSTPATRMMVFDDGRGRLGPMADLRASFEVRTGICSTAARLRAWRPRTLAGYWVPDAFAEVVSARADAPVNRLPDEEAILCVNGRLAVPDDAIELELGEALVEAATGDCIAAHLRHADARYFLSTGELGERIRARRTDARRLYRHPWDVIAGLPQALAHDFAHERMPDSLDAAEHADVAGDHPIDLHPTARLSAGVVLDATDGPILVDAKAVLRPGAVLCGPCAVLREAVVTERATIRGNVVVGPLCKVGGEVSSTIFQGCSNKAHEGHLGHAWIGKWVNLGAGTTNSNLLNTYGEVTMRAEADGPRLRTGMQFLGAIVGDHVKTAIGTRIMTGTSIGTGAMVALSGYAPTAIRRFAWLTDEGERVFRFDKFMETARAVMSRRGREPTPAMVDLLRTLHDTRA